MSFDGIFLHHMTAELQPLVGGRIQKINQPFDQELVLTVRSAGKSHKHFAVSASCFWSCSADQN